MEEHWKPIHSLNDKYEASNTGHIRNALTKKQLKEFNNTNGYLGMTVRPEPNHTVNIRIHKKVAEAFLGEPLSGYVINHKDGNKHNNRIENLEYVTSSENNIHALLTGLRKPANMSLYSPRGENHYRSKITEEEAVEILKYHYRTGYGCRKISKHLGYSCGIIQGLISTTRPRWTHIDREAIQDEVRKEIR